MNNSLLLRIIAPLVATSLLLLTLGVGAAWYVHDLQTKVSQDLLTNTSGLRAGEELEIKVWEIRTELGYYLRKGERKHLTAIADLRHSTEHWLSEGKRWSRTARKKELMEQAQSGYDQFVKDLESLPPKGVDDSRSRVIENLLGVLKDQILKPAHEYLDVNEEEVAQSITENQTFADRLAWGLLLLGVCGSGAGLLAGFGLARGINRQLIQLSVPIRNAAGRLDEVVGPITFAASANLEEIETVLHSISERIGAIIDRLRQSERQVLQTEHLASVGQLAAGMAHELRNPLTSMKILVQAALSRKDDGGRMKDEKEESSSRSLDSGPCLAGRDLLVLEEEITRLERLVQSFLQFARPPRTDMKPLEVAPLIEQAIGLVAGRASVSQTRIEFMHPAEPVLANLDAGQFRQVLLNLLLNALDAGKTAGMMQVRLEYGTDDWLTIRVADDGCGLPEDLGTRIFVPFVTTKETGLGLGLSICKRIAEAHGGDISAANRPQGGAVFTLRLPPVDGRKPVKTRTLELIDSSKPLTM